MNASTRIGYARCAADADDVDKMDTALAVLGCDRKYLDTSGLTGAGHERPELQRALARCQPGDTLVVPSFERLVTSLADAARTLAQLADRGILLEVNGSRVDQPGDATHTHLWAFVEAAQLQSALLRLHTREGIAAAERKKGQRRGRQPILDRTTQALIRKLHDGGRGTSISQLARDFRVSRSTIRRALDDDYILVSASEGNR